MTKKKSEMTQEEHDKALEYGRRGRLKKKLNKPMSFGWRLYGDRLFNEYNEAYPPPAEPLTGNE